MGSKLTDRLYEDYGGSTVVGKGSGGRSTWIIRWKCCGKEQEVSSSRCVALNKNMTARCVECIKKSVESNPKNKYPNVVARKELQKYVKNHPNEKPVEFIMVNGYPWYFLSSSNKSKEYGEV